MPIRILPLAALLSVLAPSAHAFGVKALDFPTPQVGYAVGWSGGILKTTDAGETWTLAHYDSIQTLFDVDFLNVDTGFAAGLRTVSDKDGIYDHLVLKTTDGGRTWNPTILEGQGILNSVHFPSPDTGFTVGNGVAFRTVDGGRHWLRLDSNRYDQRCVRFTDPENGFITGYQYFHETHDGGVTWKLTPLHPLRVYSKIRFLDARTGWRGGGYNLDRTRDGGKTWEDFSLPQTGGGFLDFHFASTDLGFFCTTNGTIGKSTDGGKTWRRIITGFGGNLDALYFTDASTGFAASANGMILKTTDGGETWTRKFGGSTGLVDRGSRATATPQASPPRDSQRLSRRMARFSLTGDGRVRYYQADGRGLLPE